MAKTEFFHGADTRFVPCEPDDARGIQGLTWVLKRKARPEYGGGWCNVEKRVLPERATRAQIVDAFGLTP